MALFCTVVKWKNPPLQNQVVVLTPDRSTDEVAQCSPQFLKGEKLVEPFLE